MRRTVSISDFGRPLNKVVTNYYDGTNDDIISTIHAALPEATNQVRSIAHKFKGTNDFETCRNIFDFLLNKITYKMDGWHQKIKMPNKLAADGAGDCKSYSLFTGAILNALHIPFKFRYASYDSTNVPQHVYVVASTKEGKCIIDAVYKKFNQEAKYTFKKDYDMRISTISGIKSNTNNFHPLAGPDPIKKVLLAAPRGAYLFLVKMNVRALATNLDKARKQNYWALADKWESLGGSWPQLDGIIIEGAKKRMLFGIENKQIQISGGTTLASITAALAAAAPIIAMLAPIIKQILGNQEVTKDNVSINDADFALSQSQAGGSEAIVPLALLSSLFLLK